MFTPVYSFLLGVELSSHPFRFVLLQVRAIYFMSMTVLQDEETQERGFVYLHFDLGPMVVKRDLNMIKRRIVSHAALPMMTVSVHICIDDILVRPVVAFASFILRRTHRLRMRVHFGELSLVLKQGKCRNRKSWPHRNHRICLF
jgi:hypothetical protein